jgi:hypothetical protein
MRNKTVEDPLLDQTFTQNRLMIESDYVYNDFPVARKACHNLNYFNEQDRDYFE